ncbi:hypothetical protein PV11_00281 [Exophiala sideris]|uniref:Lipocalin-like domain-containing protein n=1 Tax=Exophiala sideris TaxID=1016849 RepID=A0A0D1X9M5_9EURO|nr:hypothetical protein PV11_00281 [Exophiala sideris]
MASFRSRLVGTWELVSFRALNIEDASDVIHPLQGDWHGLIIYTADGYMSVQMQNREVPRTGGGPVPGKPEDLAELTRRTTNYTGPYHLEEPGTGGDEAKVHHETVIAIPSIYNGITQTRLARLLNEDGVEQLILTTGEPAMIEGVKRDIVVTWRRAKDNSTSSKPRQEVSAPFSK